MIKAIKFDSESNYDLAIVACSYEVRAQRLLTKPFKAINKIAIGYASNEIHSFEQNKILMQSSGFDFFAYSDSEFDSALSKLLDLYRPASILLDISCFTRLRLAQLLFKIVDSVKFVDCFYSLAHFTSPGADPPYEYLGPISDSLSGFGHNFSRPVSCISGLGYEFYRAVGVIEFLDPARVWVWRPKSPILEYDFAVNKANALLLADLSQGSVVDYKVLNFEELTSDLMMLVGNLRRQSACVLLPFGPKLFAAAAILVGYCFPDVAVWRASAGVHCEPVDQEASDFEVFVRLDAIALKRFRGLVIQSLAN